MSHRLSKPLAASINALCLALAASAAQAGDGPSAAAGGPVPEARGDLAIELLSSRHGAVSGGDALLKITVPRGTPQRAFTVRAGRANISSAFRRTARGEYIGRVDGLAEGLNRIVLKTRGSDGDTVSLLLRNHPITGPIVSGPHQLPFVCGTEAAGLGAPMDANCSAPTQVSYRYRGTGGDFKAFDAAAPRPADMATTLDARGRPMDFIVRLERGTINRAIYEIAFRHLPGTPLPDPWRDARGWNNKLVYTFGGGCGAAYRQNTSSGGVLLGVALDAGYAVASSTLNVFGNDCNDVRSAETASMVKEHLIEKFGPVAYTVGYGGSGGSMQQHLIAQNYPGLLDGILPFGSYPDLFSILPFVSDCRLLSDAIGASAQAWTDAQKTAVSGFATWNTCNAWVGSFATAWIDPKACAADVPNVYDPVTNPSGTRCTIADNMVNQFGIDPATGSARRPLDNVGVQYGLAAFNAGAISAEQFVELNEKVGGFDDDGKVVPQRTVAHADALRHAFEKGRINSAAEALGTMPIIDYRPYLDTAGDIHDRVRSFSTRERLIRANGHADNHVILIYGLDRGIVSAPIEAELLDVMDQWLTGLLNDRSAASVQAKLAKHKPAGARDGCWSPTERIYEPASADGTGLCNQLYPVNRDPRQAAGAPLANDVMKCQLKPIDPAGYAQPLSAQQLGRLVTVFPAGVCDWSLPSAGRADLIGTWLRY